MNKDDCKNDLNYAIDCPMKKALKKIINQPDHYHIKSWELTDKVKNCDPGKTYDVYTGIKLEIDLPSNFFFSINGRLESG